MNNTIQLKKVTLLLISVLIVLFIGSAPFSAFQVGSPKYVTPDVYESDRKSGSDMEIESEYKESSFLEKDSRQLREKVFIDKMIPKISPLKFVKRKGELLIPANGNCLFISVLVGYLLPVRDHEKEFKNRCVNLLGKQETSQMADYLWKNIKNITSGDYLEILKSNYFNQVIVKALRKQMNCDESQWGGVNDMQKMTDKLQIAIQLHIPNSEKSNKTLVTSDLIKPSRGDYKSVIEIVQDVAASEEAVVGEMNSLGEIMGTLASIEDQQHQQHFRLKAPKTLTSEIKKQKKVVSLKMKENVLADKYKTELKAVKVDLLKPNYSPKEYDDHVYLALQKGSSKLMKEKLKREEKVPFSIAKYLSLLIYELNLKGKNKKEKIHEESIFQDKNEFDLVDNAKENVLELLCEKVIEYAVNYIKQNELLDIVNSKMKSIKSFIVVEEWENASKFCAELLREIQPVNIQETLLYAKKAEDASSFIEGKHVVLFVGSTGVGKSTTLLYLMGCKMQQVREKNLIHIKADKSFALAKYRNQMSYITSSAQDRSETRYITGITINPMDFDITDSNDMSEIILCDTPGFSDTSGPEVDIANGTGVIKAIQKAKGVTIAFLLNENSLYVTRMQPIVDVIYLVSKMMPKFSDNSKAFTYLFTKVANPDRGKQIHQKFENLLKLEKEGKVDPFDPAARTILADITVRTKKTWIVDPIRSLANSKDNALKTPEAKEILEHFITGANYIQNPKKVFQTYLSGNSAKALKQQLSYHRDTILSAIENENFVLANYMLNEVKAIQELLQNANINSTYQDITKEAAKLWNIIADKDMDSFEEHIFSPKKFDQKIFDRYQTIYALYYYYDSKIRGGHFREKGMSSQVFMIRLKSILSSLRAKILINPLADAAVTAGYLEKMNGIASIFEAFIPFAEKTRNLLDDYFRTMERNTEKLIQKNQLEEIKEILINLKKALLIEDKQGEKLIDIEKHYEHIKSEFLKHYQDMVKEIYKDFGMAGSFSLSKDIGEGLDLGESQNSDTQVLSFGWKHIISDVKNYYNALENAHSFFNNNRDLPEVAKSIEQTYKQFMELTISCIKACRKKIVSGIKSNVSYGTSQLKNLTKIVQNLREIPEIGYKTYNDYVIIQQTMNSQLEERKVNIKPLVQDFFNKKSRNAIQEISQYIENISESLLISEEEKKQLLGPLGKEFTRRLKRLSSQSEGLYLSLNRNRDTDFIQLGDIMDKLNMLQEYHILNSFEGVRKYYKKIIKSATNKVKLTAKNISICFNQDNEKLEIQEKRLELLKGYVANIKALEDEKGSFAEKIKKLSDVAVIDKETLEKSICGIDEKIKKAENDILVCKNKEKETAQELDFEIQELKKARKKCMDYREAAYDDETTLEANNQVKSFLTNQGFKFTTFKELVNELKKKVKEKKSQNDNLKIDLDKIEKDVKDLKEEKINKKEILESYCKNKKKVEEDIQESINLLKQEFLPISILKKLKKKDVKIANQEIIKLEININYCKENELNSIRKKLDSAKASKALEYLERTKKVDWGDEEPLGDDDDGSSGSDPFVDMEYFLVEVHSNLVKYLTNYSETIKEEISSSLTNFSKSVNDLNNSKQKSTEKWVSCCKEIENWKKYYSKTLFNPYIAKDFIIRMADLLIQIVKKLESNVGKSRVANSKNIQKMFISNQRAMKVSKLSDLWGDAPRMAHAICQNYDNQISRKINNEKVVKFIKEKDYRNAHKAMSQLLGNINIMTLGNENNGGIITETKFAVYNSIDQLIVNLQNDMSSLSLEEFDTSKNTQNRTTKLCEKIKKLAAAKQYFFSKEQNTNFLGEYADEFHREIKNIEKHFERWAESALPKINNNIAANQFARAIKQFNSLLQTKKKIQATNLFEKKLIDDVIKKIKKSIENKIQEIKQSFSSNNSIENHNINPFSGLDFIYEELIKAGKTKAAEEIKDEASKYYRKYLKSINNNQMSDLDEQSSRLKLAAQMLSSMPKLLKSQLESNYNIIKIQVNKNLDNRDIDVEKIRKNKTPQEDINSWHKHKNKAKTSLAYMEVRNNIKKRSYKIYNEFKLSLNQGKLDKASEYLQQLTLYKEHLDEIRFKNVYNIYNKAISSKVEYGDHLLDQLDNATENLNQVPEILEDIVFKMQYFVKYKEALL